MALSEKQHTECAQCGMVCAQNEYHPYAACLMFTACKDGEVVRANLAEGHKQDTALIRQLVEALENSPPHTDRAFVWRDGEWKNQRTAATIAARARLEGKP